MTDSTIIVTRTSRFCCSPPIADKDFVTATSGCSFKFYNNAWRTYTKDDIDHLNSALMSNDLESDSIPEFLNRFFPDHPLARLAFSFNYEDGGPSRGHPVVIQFKPIDGATCKAIENVTKKHPTLTSSHLPTRSSSPYGAFTDGSPLCSTPEFDSDVSSSPDSSVVRFSSEMPLNKSAQATPSSLSLAFEFSSGLCVLRKRKKQQQQQQQAASTTEGLEVSAACSDDHPEWEALVIRREGDQFYEVAKGHLEHGETLEEAAERELREETGILNRVVVGDPLLSEIYTVKTAEISRVEKTVHYFSAELRECTTEALMLAEEELLWSTDMCEKCCRTAQVNASTRRTSGHVEVNNRSLSSSSSTTPSTTSNSNVIDGLQPAASCCCSLPEYVAYFGQREKETRELCWVTLEEARNLFWKSNTVLNVVAMALIRKQPQQTP